MKQLREHPQTRHLKMGLVVPMTSLRETLKSVFQRSPGLNKNMVIGAGDAVKAPFDLLIVDEAHRLRRRNNLTNYKSFDDVNRTLGLGNSGTELDWVRASSKQQILLYDQDQTVRPTDIRPQAIGALGGTHFQLTSQLRVQGGDDYLEFVARLLAGDPIPWSGAGGYDFRVAHNFRELQSLIRVREEEHQLCRMVAGFAWPWTTRGGDGYDMEIDGVQLKWNSVTKDWINSPNSPEEVGCIHTIQGYDLNFVGVIFGPEVGYDPNRKCLVVYPDKYEDKNGKHGVNDPAELERYILNIYKTLMTRGIRGTYIYAVDSELQRYFASLN